MRLTLLGFLVFFCRRAIYELKKTAHSYDESEAKHHTTEGQAKSKA